jgi:DnaJ homolog subfamily A member 5
MRDENEELDLDDSFEADHADQASELEELPSAETASSLPPSASSDRHLHSVKEGSAETESTNTTSKFNPADKRPSKPVVERSSRGLTESGSKPLQGNKGEPNDKLPGEEDPSNSTSPQLSKREKRRAREATKKQRAEQSPGEPQLVVISSDSFYHMPTHAIQSCNVCHEKFNTRTELFAHIRKEFHESAEKQPEPEKPRNATKKGKPGKT